MNINFKKGKSKNRNRILFYSSLKDKKDFYTQGFYLTDIRILENLGFKVKLSNHWYDFLLNSKYDICFIYFYRYGLIPGFIGRVFGKMVLFTGGIDNLELEYASRWELLVQRILFILCDFCSNVNIIVSTSDKNNIQLFKDIRFADKYPLSFHVIDYEKYEYLNDIKKEKIFVTIAWMITEANTLRKGIDKAVRVFEKVYRKDAGYKMVIIGVTGDGTEIIKNLITEYQLENQIVFTGRIPENEKISILKRSKIYIQLSSYEGFGIGAVEALAAGCIVIHSGKGGLKDGIADNGIEVIDVNDYDEICNKILSLDENSCNELIAKGIQHVKTNFKYEKRLKDFSNIFNNFKESN